MIEDEVRRIVREEIKLTLEALAVEAHKLDTYDAGELLAAGLSAVRQAANAAAGIVDHAMDCQLREDSGWVVCTCGVETD